MAQDRWLQDFEAAKELAGQTAQLIQERNALGEGNPEASRLTSVARRKLSSLGAALDGLKASVEAAQHLSENERNRRRDLVLGLRSRHGQMLTSLRRAGAGGAASDGASAHETSRTAPLDNQGLLTLQGQIMREQDRDLESLETSVAGTRHIALQINEEAELHNRLLDELDGEVDTTTARLRAAQRRLKHVLKSGASCRQQCYLLLVAFLIALALIIIFKIASIF